MPLGIFLLWPSLHLMYGLTEHRSQKIDAKRRYAGRLIIILSLFFISQPYGLEKGIFYWLFAFMAIALAFVQLRVWHPLLVNIITISSMLTFLMIGGSYVFS
ncbi:MAG: hypothetical protein JKY50_06060 [Oleispira sp.]|nr:hypothetical protein [Oleispira sp.]MBL4880518.1 hypothetical protein [Oleispira sp.]